MIRVVTAASALIAVLGVAVAQHAPHGGHTPYAGQQLRAISSLSDAEARGFLEGAGMGLARSAELNGYPGPMHVLELEAELKLTPEQRALVATAMANVKARLRELGARYVAAENSVDDAFRSGASADEIAARVRDAGGLLTEIRMAHLAAHLEITPHLTQMQRQRYAQLRGYTTVRSGPHPHKH